MSNRFSIFSHPKKVCMTYFEHMKFSFYLAFKFFIAAIIAVIHGFLPDYFITHSSDTLKQLSDDIKNVGCRSKKK
tara:strand:- start:687 stop:911 length:225 start_codon:yes stop_codon:yes gene_type:complete